MQLQILEKAWAYYRGTQNEQGCVLNDTAARRSVQICRDYEPSTGTVWYEGSENIYDCYALPKLGDPSPWNFELYFGDRPKHEINLNVLNPQTNRYNYLHEARCALAFFTTLTEQVKPGIYTHHRHFFWSAIWHIRNRSSQPAKLSDEFKFLPGSGFWVSDFKRGAPHDRRYLQALDDSSITRSANQISAEAPVVKSVASNW